LKPRLCGGKTEPPIGPAISEVVKIGCEHAESLSGKGADSTDEPLFRFALKTQVLFNSIDFAIFLPIVFLFYWALPARFYQLQNLLIVIASFVFYGFWDWRFLSLLIISASTDFGIGLALQATAKAASRKALLVTSILVNLGLLGFFKYFGFFIESFTAAFTIIGKPIEGPSLSIILPAGISFYTFQTLSYSIDVYRKRMKPTRNPITFLAFVSFFPQLVAGPIERAADLLPQFEVPRRFEYDAGRDALRQILWGLFKKVVIADNCGRYVSLVFEAPETYPASQLGLTAFLFAIQIYGDFSGYCDIAIGTARLLGFRLHRNFDCPYFSRNLAEFWSRWHISLTNWFRDYVYIPLGGGHGGRFRTVVNVSIVFLLSGLWHGANWTFVTWGLFNAVCMMPRILLTPRSPGDNAVSSTLTHPTYRDLPWILANFTLVCIGWILFRSASLSEAAAYFSRLFQSSWLIAPPIFPSRILILVLVTLCVEWFFRDKEHGLDFSGLAIPRPIRWAIYQIILLAIYSFGIPNQTFIYFQF